MKLSLIVALAIVPFIAAFPMNGHISKLIRIKPQSIEHVEIMQTLEKAFKINYLAPVTNALRPVSLILDSTLEHRFLFALNRSGISYNVLSDNVQALWDEERTQIQLARNGLGGLKGDDYDYVNSWHNYEEIRDQIKFLAQKYSTIAKYLNIGTSFEGREIPALSIGSGSEVIIFECGIHAREWISMAWGAWLANHLLGDETSALRVKYTLIVVPVLNVDGFAFTHTADRSARMWRKNRVKKTGSECIGVDLNRNFDTKYFGQVGVSNDPCDDTFCGPSAASELETQALVKLVLPHKGHIAAYFSFHSYSNLWMYPYGYTNQSAPNSVDLEKISKEVVKAMEKSGGEVFNEGQISTTIYPVSGDTIDWVYDAAGVKNSFVLEMRGRDFTLPIEEIKPAVLETWAGVKTAIDLL